MTTVVSVYGPGPNPKSLTVFSGYPGAPILGEDGNPHNPAGQAVWDAAHSGGNTPAPYQEPTPTLAEYGLAIDQFLDAEVQTHGYRDVGSAISYRGSGVPQWVAEATAVSDWRDAVYQTGYDVLAQVQAGTIEPPTIPALLALLPAITWPA